MRLPSIASISIESTNVTREAVARAKQQRPELSIWTGFPADQ
jgi:hypothetical protein